MSASLKRHLSLAGAILAFTWLTILAQACFLTANAQAATVTFDFEGVGSESSDLQNYMQGLFGSTNLGTSDLKASNDTTLFHSGAIRTKNHSSGTLDFDVLADTASTYEMLSVSFTWGVYTATSGIDFGLDVYDDATGTWRSNVFTVYSNSLQTGQTGVLTFDSAWQVTRLRIHDSNAHDVGIDDLTIVDNRSVPDPPPASVPEPSTLLLLGSGIAVMGYARRRFRR